MRGQRATFARSTMLLSDGRSQTGRRCAVPIAFSTLLKQDPFIYKTLVRD